MDNHIDHNGTLPIMMIAIMIMMIMIRSKHRDPSTKDNSLIRKETSTHKGFHHTFAAMLSYQGILVKVRVPLFATHPRVSTEVAFGHFIHGDLSIISPTIFQHNHRIKTSTPLSS